MYNKIKPLIKDCGIYGSFNVLSQAVGFILIPLYTRYLTPAHYGTLEIVQTTFLFLSIFFGLGMSSALVRYYGFYPNQKDKNEVFNTAFFFIMFVSVVLSIILISFSSKISLILLGNIEYGVFFKISFLTLFFYNTYLIPFALFRVKNESLKYSLLSLCGVFLRLCLAIYLVGVLKKGILGILIAESTAALAITISCIFSIRKDISFRFSTSYLKDLLYFGLPLIPANLGMVILAGSDRYFLEHFSNLQEVGLYALGCKLAAIMTLVIGAFQLSWGPFLFSIEKEKNAREIYSRILTHFLLVMGLLSLGLSIFAKELVMLLSTPTYFDAHRVVSLIALAYLLHGVYVVVGVGINLKNKTIYFPIVIGMVAILNLVLNYLFIPKYGMMGAAVATLISYFFMVLGIYWSSRKYYPINYEWMRIGKITLVWLGLYIVAAVAKFRTFSEELLLKSLLLATYPVLLFFMRFFTPGELTKLKQITRQINFKK